MGEGSLCRLSIAVLALCIVLPHLARGDSEVARQSGAPDYDSSNVDGLVFFRRYRDSACSELMGDAVFQTLASTSSSYVNTGYAASAVSNLGKVDHLTFSRSGSHSTTVTRHNGCTGSSSYFNPSDCTSTTTVTFDTYLSSVSDCAAVTMPWGTTEYLELYDSTSDVWQAPYGWISVWGMTGASQVVLRPFSTDCDSTPVITVFEVDTCYYISTQELSGYNSAMYSFDSSEDARSVTYYTGTDCTGSTKTATIPYGTCGKLDSSSSRYVTARGKFNEWWAAAIVAGLILLVLTPIAVVPCSWPLHIFFGYLTIAGIVFYAKYGSYPFDSTSNFDTTTTDTWTGS